MWGRHVLAEVRIYDGESIESALRRFKRQVQQEGILKEVKRHSFFLKPGEKKRLKSKLAQKPNGRRCDDNQLKRTPRQRHEHPVNRKSQSDLRARNTASYGR